MNDKSLNFYKEKLLGVKQKILNSGLLKNAEDLQVSPDDLPDEADLANSVINQQVSFSIRHRELSKLREIEEALHRIEDGTYGYCQDCDEEIPKARLTNQPWASLCVIHAEEREKENLQFGRRA